MGNDEMTGYISFCLLLFLTGHCDCIPRRLMPFFLNGNVGRYCSICADHTMCQFPFDDEGIRCEDLENGDLDEKDIEAVVEQHNIYRDTIASGEEQRGNPGPQRPAKYMMEMIWDIELAHIARRWALQCNLLEKDQCRDVERFGVWQNVHVLDMDSVGNVTSTARIHFHIQSWYDEVEYFDSAEFGYVNFSARSDLSYIAFAAATISRVGCGRAIYTARRDVSRRMFLSASEYALPFEFGHRVEALVCNYGPLDRKSPGQLYEDGAPGLCPRGTIQSPRYGALCRKFQDPSFRRKMERNGEQKWDDEEVRRNDGTLVIPCAVYIGQLLLLLWLCDCWLSSIVN